MTELHGERWGEQMNNFAKLLNCYVEQNPPICGDAQAVVDQLYWAYMENHRIDNDKSNECYAALREQVKLPMREYDEVLYIVSDLCLEHGRMAFMEGLKVGILLMQKFCTEL